MWNSNAGEDAGAGFVKDDSAKAGGSGGSGEARGRRSLMPVNSQVLRSLCIPATSSLIVHRQKISYVSLIGQIGKLDINSAKVDMTIIDSYGPPVDVLFWQGEERCADLAPEMFVEVVGTPRDVNNSIGLYAFSVHKITNITQIINHNLEVILYGKALEKMKHNFLNQQNLDQAFPNYEDPNLSALAGQSTDIYRNSYTAPTATQAAAAKAPANGGAMSIKELGDKVLNYLQKEASGENGAHIDAIQRDLKFDQAKLKDVMEYLSSEGHVYTTTDDDHFKSTEG